MSYLNILGGRPLCGTVAVSGSKNATLPMMAAALLADGPVRLQNVPRVTDVWTLSRVLDDLGLAVTRSGDELLLEVVDVAPIRAGYRWVHRMRAGFCVLGPLLARRGRAVVPLPGGCAIGDRPVDLHLKGLAALGAEVRLEHGYVVASARRLAGTSLDLTGPRGPTVTGTANVLSAAVLARGTTVIRGAAREPEIVELGQFLRAMGAQIDGLGTGRIEVTGVAGLRGGTHRVTADRIETATLLIAAAISGGSATIAGVVPEHLERVLQKLRAAGMRVAVDRDRVSLAADGPPLPVDLLAEPYPGISTDLQAQWTALMSLAHGRSRVEDRVFPMRFRHVAELNRLGAGIVCGSGAACIPGGARLSGAQVTACDLRASAALVLAGLAAAGRTVVRRIDPMDRGYERLDRKLRQLGAHIQRVAGPSPTRVSP
ncbi:MAG: UDP-N-acetylglucosamine 1-carboxyvinyltransferase [Thermoguttaceae bacterium]|jgi:UDP-N-acetylglucosamine 1-carboxyvinyltransferase